MRKTLATLATAALLSLGVASPAKANQIANCDDSVGWTGKGVICLYDGTNFGTYHWTTFDLGYIQNQANDCLQLSSDFINVISSFVINPTPAASGTLASYYVDFWPNNNCTGTPVPHYSAWQEHSNSDMRTSAWGNISNVLNSVSVRFYS